MTTRSLDYVCNCYGSNDDSHLESDIKSDDERNVSAGDYQSSNSFDRSINFQKLNNVMV